MILSHADHAASLSHADLADFTDMLITRIADHAASLSHADHADFTDRLITLIDFSCRLFLICKIGRSVRICPICMPLRLTHADHADFTDRLIPQIGCFLIKTTRTTNTT